MGNNNIGYYTPKKAGITEVKISDPEGGVLSIVIIVRQAKPGSQYISTPEPIVQILPGTSNHVINVALDGGEESDEKDFKWQIYGQLPSSPEVAKAGGAVVSLYGIFTFIIFVIIIAGVVCVASDKNAYHYCRQGNNAEKCGKELVQVFHGKPSLGAVSLFTAD